ncbi:MAG: hypothetical protein AB1597_02310 [Chloroflexota bacterium]
MENQLDTIAMTRRNMRYAALYRSVKLVLEIGVAAALVLLAAGLVVNAFAGGAAPTAVMTLGVLVLLATPVLAVLVVAGFSIRLHDWVGLTASSVIIGVLIVSLVLALGIG